MVNEKKKNENQRKFKIEISWIKEIWKKMVNEKMKMEENVKWKRMVNEVKMLNEKWWMKEDGK